MLWPLVFQQNNFIHFAHTSFLWSNLASNKAAVTCVILGLSAAPKTDKQLFDEEIVRCVPNISPYLVATDTVIVTKRSNALSDIGRMQSGNKPTDGGSLMLTTDEKEAIVARNPTAARFIKRYVGSKELINGGGRWCIWVESSEVEQAKQIDEFKARFNRVQQLRMSGGAQANDNADTPHRFVFAPHSDHGAIAVWIATVCGKMKTDFRYSNTLGWNTFPVPLLTEQNKADLTTCAEAILLARETHFPASLADLYDPDNMPENLRYAHERNDEVLERIYIGRRFRNDTERLEKLFDLYTKMTAEAAKVPPKAKRGKKA
jgi:hypothetical protein